MSRQTAWQFALYMMSKSKFLYDAGKHEVADSDPSEPLPTMLLGNIGGQVAKRCNQIDESEWEIINGLVEEGMKSSDEYVSTAVATGFIEGLMHRAEEVEGLWPKIEARLGPLAREYAEAYRNIDYTVGEHRARE